MAFDGSDQCWAPDIPVGRDDEWRLRIAQFGDGYSQRVLDGINALNRKWSLTWDMREKDVLNAMVDYLVAQKAKAFNFQEPQTAVTYKVFCDSWHIEWTLRRRPVGAATEPTWYGSLSAEFTRANGLTS